MNDPGGHMAYERKLEQLQRYIPFLRKMITKLERTNDPARAAQLQKMRHLHGILTDRTRKLKYDLLVKCEGVLQKLHDKIEGEPDDDVMEVPSPAPPRPPEVPRPMLYPESEWERPSPPRELPASQASTSSSSTISRPPEDLPQHSPPLSSFVERISMSSPSNYNDAAQPRSPSPEVVAQIPGAFAQGREPSNSRFEKGREILRKLMAGMSKTLDETTVDSPTEVEQSCKGPKIIPLERASSSGTPDAEPLVDDAEERMRGTSDRASTSAHGSTTTSVSKDAEVYNPEIEWSEVRTKASLRPQFMAKPPLSQADLEELNRDLGTESSTQAEKEESHKSNDASQSESQVQSKSHERSSRQQSGNESRGKANSKGEERSRSSSASKPEVRKGETLAEAQRRQFEEWKRSETEKFRERRKRQRAEAKAAEGRRSREGRPHSDVSRPSHTHRKPHSTERSSSHSSGHHQGDRVSVRDDRRASVPTEKTSDTRGASGSNRGSSGRASSDAKEVADHKLKGPPQDDSSVPSDPDVKLVSEKLKKYSVQDLMKTVQQGLSPVRKKDVTVDDLECSYKCLLLRDLPPNTLRHNILRFFQGFAMTEMVLEVNSSSNCTGIGYVQLVDHAEAKRARQNLCDKSVLAKPVKMAPCAEGIFKEAKRTYEQAMNAREERVLLASPPLKPLLATPPQRNYPQPYPSSANKQSPRASHPALSGFNPGQVRPGLMGYTPDSISPHSPNVRFQKHSPLPRQQAYGSQPSTRPFYNPYDAPTGRSAHPGKADPRLDRGDPRRVDTHLNIEDTRKVDPRKSDPRLRMADARKGDQSTAKCDPRLTDPRLNVPEGKQVDPRMARPTDPRKLKADTRINDPSSGRGSHKTGDPRTLSTEPRPGGTDPRRHNIPKVSKTDPREAARLSFEEQHKHKREKELALLRKRKEEREKNRRKEERSRSHSRSSAPDKKSSSDHKSASLSSFKIPKLKRPESVEEPKKEGQGQPIPKESCESTAQGARDPQPVSAPSQDGTVHKESETATCHQEDIVSSTVDTDELLGSKKKKRTRIVVISDSESDSECSKPVSNEQKPALVEEKILVGTKKPEEPIREEPQAVNEDLKCLLTREQEADDAEPGKSAAESDTEDDVMERDSDVENTESEDPLPPSDTLPPMTKKPVVVLTRSEIPVTVSDRSSSKANQEAMTVKVVPEIAHVEPEESTLIEDIADKHLQRKEDVTEQPQVSEAEVTDESSVPIESGEKAVEPPKSPSPVPAPKKRERDPQIEPEECEYCPFNGKKVIPHYVVSHPGKPISVKMSPEMLQEAVGEDLGPGDDSARTPLPPELEKNLINDDLSWIPGSVQFDYNVACRYCKFTALNKRHMLQHVADHLQTGTSAPDQYSLRCRFCKIKHCSSHDMTDHISSHTGEYRYSCRHCGYRVFRMFHLKNHMSSIHKGKAHDDIAIEDVKTGNDWVYGYVCKLCGYVQINEKNVQKHMTDCHGDSEEMVRINLVVRGPPVDMSKKVSEALRRQRAEEERRAAALPPPIDDITVFQVGEAWLSEQSAQVSTRRAQMDTLLSGHSARLTVPSDDRCSSLLEKLALESETPLQYLEAERQRRVAERSAAPDEDEPASLEPGPAEEPATQEPDAESGSEQEPESADAPEWEAPPEDVASVPTLVAELRASAPQDTSEFGYRVTMRLAGALEVRYAPMPPPPPPPLTSGFAVKQEPVDPALAESDARAAEGLSAMNEDLESLMSAFDQFEQEQEETRPTLRIRRLSGDLLSADSESGIGGMGLMISSVMSLTGGAETEASGAPRADEGLFAFPPEGDRRPWKYFLTLKDQSKVMRLMFHMHHKSAYKCNAVHCSLTTNNGTLFKLHLRNHERCDICAGQRSGYTCMNTRLVCVYCGYQGADLAEHVYRRHAVSQFQCGYCFYRTRQNAYMHEHQRRWHGDMPTYFLQSDPANPPPGLNASHLQETEMVGESSLAPYVCAQPGCTGSFIKAAVLEQHYLESHADVTSFPCHVCDCTTQTFKELIVHYIGHGFVAYHCAYCRYAHQNQNNVKKHLIDFHPDDPPKCYARIPKSMGLDTVSTAATPSQDQPAALAEVKQEPGCEPSSSALTAATSAVKEEPRVEPPEPPSVELEEAGDAAAEPAKEPPAPEKPPEPTPAEQESEERRLVAEDLYRCGNPRCSVRCDSLAAFREHLTSCPLTEAGQLLCYHCPKQVKHVSTALEHIRLHGPRRYLCSLCDFSASVPSYVTKHLKQQHRVLVCTTLPQLPDAADPERDAFVVYPKLLVPRAEQPAAANGLETEMGYGADDVERLPRRPVLFRPVQCRICSFSTKVTRNLWKHLLRHQRAGETTVPSAAPTNPRPCDQRQNMMFDQMANLASSSGEVGAPRRQAEITEADLERLPKEVSEDKRYICSLPNCNYLTLNDTMLKYHIQALHGQMITYPCPHCTDLYMIPDKLSTHLRLHGPRLYKCKYCIYNHYQRKLVTRHVRDKHPMLPLVDVVVREPEDDETAAKPVFKPWRCGLCKYAALTQPEAVEHAAAVHDLRSQYKCGLCSVRSSVRSAFQLHFAAKHPDQPVKVFAIYYKMDEETVDTTVRTEQCQPIWQRNNPRRIRHVRGILIEEVKVPRGAGSPQKRGRRSAGSASSSPVKRPPVEPTVKAERKEAAARKAPANQVRRRALKKALRQQPARRLRARPKPAKPESGAESPSPSPELLTPTQSPESAPDSPKLVGEEPVAPPPPPPPRAPPATEDEFLSLYETETAALELGPLGDAEDGMFVCPKCLKYKTKRRQDFTKHLYKELNYNRFVCGNCGHMNTTLPNMKRHHEQVHKPARVPEAVVPLTPDRELELWMQSVLDRQQKQIDGDDPPSLAPATDAAPQPEPSVDPQPNQQPAAEAEPDPDGPSPGSAAAASRASVIYKCWYCTEQGTIPVLRIHWRAHHTGQRFKVMRQAQRLACQHCAYSTTKQAVMRAHLTEKHPGSGASDFIRHSVQRETRYRCGYCGERFKTLDAGTEHHKRKHADSETKLEPYIARAPRGKSRPETAAKVESSLLPKEEPVKTESDPAESAESAAPAAPLSLPSSSGNTPLKQCPMCSYSTTRLRNIDSHLGVHFRRYKCGLCDFTDCARFVVVNHHERRHPEQPQQVLLLEEVQKQFMLMKQRVRDQQPAGASSGERAASPSPRGVKRPLPDAEDTAATPPIAKQRPSGGVARKSTARSRLNARAGRAVAVKSTGGLRRCFVEPFSFYGQKPPPVSAFSEVTTPLTVGGASAMRVNVPTLAQIVKLYPQCRCVDLRTGSLHL